MVASRAAFQMFVAAMAETIAASRVAWPMFLSALQTKGKPSLKYQKYFADIFNSVA